MTFLKRCLALPVTRVGPSAEGIELTLPQEGGNHLCFPPSQDLKKTAIPVSYKKTKTCSAFPASRREAKTQAAISQDFEQVMWESFHVCYFLRLKKHQREDPNFFRADQEPIYRKCFNVRAIQSILCGNKLNTGSVAMSLAQGEAVTCKVLHPDHVAIDQFFYPSVSFGLQLLLYGRNIFLLCGRSGGRKEAERKK